MCIEVKVCGITNKGDAINSIQAGADYLGFILYSQSPRSYEVNFSFFSHHLILPINSSVNSSSE